MAPVVTFLVLAMHLFSPTYSQGSAQVDHESSTNSIVWLAGHRTVFVRLDTPGLPLLTWDVDKKDFIVEDDVPSAIVLKYSLSSDNKTLCLLDRPFLPLSNPSEPPMLWAPQIRASTPGYRLPMLFDRAQGSWATVGLDYDRLSYPLDDPSIIYYNYRPTIQLNILGIGFRNNTMLLTSPEQKMVKVKLRDHNGQAENPPRSNFEIIDLKFVSRERQYIHPKPLEDCTLWSWRCGDFETKPWYRYIWRQNFDSDGRIGSLRHAVVSRWNRIQDRVGSEAWIVTIVLCSLAVAVAVSYGLFLGARMAKVWWDERRREAGDDEELLLQVEDIDDPPPPYVPKHEKPLPPLPAETTDIPPDYDEILI